MNDDDEYDYFRNQEPPSMPPGWWLVPCAVLGMLVWAAACYALTLWLL